MSRIGKMPIAIPPQVSVELDSELIQVKGPKGNMSQSYLPCVTVAIRDDFCYVERCNEEKQTMALHGLYRTLISNMIEGVTKGFSKTLLISGVGYRAEVDGDVLVLHLGYSNPVGYTIPNDVDIVAENQQKVVVSGISKSRVGQIAAEIRSLRPPEPYKGKGIKYETEQIIRKVGKSGVK